MVVDACTTMSRQDTEKNDTKNCVCEYILNKGVTSRFNLSQFPGFCSSKRHDTDLVSTYKTVRCICLHRHVSRLRSSLQLLQPLCLKKIKYIPALSCVVCRGRRQQFICNFFKMSDISRSVILHIQGKIFVIFELHNRDKMKHCKLESSP